MDKEKISTETTSSIPKEKPKLRRRAIYILPNLVTTTSLFFAFLSIINSINQRPALAAFCIIISSIMDGLDGKVARLTGTSSEFGVQYDSLCDLVAFGLAPAILMWCTFIKGSVLSDIGNGVAFLYIACAALRLARFNVAAMVENPEKKFFVGLPSPAAGLTLAAFVLFLSIQPYTMELYFTSVIALALTALAGLLMVSRVRYYSFKDFTWAKTHPFQTLVLFVFLLVLLTTNTELLFFPIIITYIFSGLIYTLVYIPLKVYKARKHEKLGH